MKQPVWILNSSLLGLFFLSQLLLFMLQRAVPRRVSISPGKIEVVQEKEATPVDIKKIYEHDLFGTYEPPVIAPQSLVEDSVAPMPKPPKVIIPEIPVEKAPIFFAPLDVILKGVIFVKDDPANCIAIVQLKKTKEERNYQVGDLIEDAQILKILSNRIIIIRSNGQQETLYLREEDAISDFNTEVKSTPKAVVEQSSDNKYIVNIDEFAKRVHNLGEFINLLDLTTVYKHGKSFGCRVGNIDQESLGGTLGFMIDDIIVRVDNYPVDDLAHRIQLYDHIMQKNSGDVIEVVLYRGEDMISLVYGLIDNAAKKVEFSSQQIYQKLMEQLGKHQAQALEEAEKSVVIQNVSDSQNIVMDAIVQDVVQVDIPSDEETILYEIEKTMGLDERQSIASSKKVISSQIIDATEKIGSLNPQTLNELDAHKKRLMEEREKLMPTLQDMKFKDRNNMMKRSSRNVIFNGTQK